MSDIHYILGAGTWAGSNGTALILPTKLSERMKDGAQMPTLRVISAGQVEQLLDGAVLRTALERALVAQAEGKADVPPRIAAHTPSGLLSAMPGFLEEVGLVTKLVSVFPGNTDLPSHMGVIVYFDPGSGLPLSLMDGEVITRDRTACTASIAADRLSRQDSKILTIIGAGVQGMAHLSFFMPLRAWEQIQIVSRDSSSAESVAASVGDERVQAVEYSGLEEAIKMSDVIALCTHADTAVFNPEWVKPGTHVSSVGSFEELPKELLNGAVIVVDHIGGVETPPPAGAAELQHLNASDVTELGALLSGTGKGRSGSTEVTVYKSTGHAVQDIAASRVVYDLATSRGIGVDIQL